MNTVDKNVQLLSSLQIKITFQDLENKIKTSGNSPGIIKTVRKILEKMQGKWEPAALFQWFDFAIEQQSGLGRIIQNSEKEIYVDLGCSMKFLEVAKYVMVCSYTIGQILDTESTQASSAGCMLEAYIIDLIGLLILEKTGDITMRIAEDQARKLGWGVSPFLSPGSVHGWRLEEQSKLCSLLPLEQINVNINNDNVLFPLKSICAVIGIGPGYDSIEVGSPCIVCSQNSKCEMRQIN